MSCAEFPQSEADAPITVLHVIGGLELVGGTNAFVLELLRSPQPGIEQFVWIHRDYPAQPDAPDRLVRRGRARAVAKSRDLFSALHDLTPLVRWIREQRQPVVLHAHSKVGLFVATLAHRLTRTPVVLNLHFHARRTGFYRWLIRTAGGAVVFNSNGTCLHYGYAPDIKWVIMPPICWPSPMASKDAASAPFRFFASGSFVPSKSLHVVLDAFARFRQGHSDAELRLFGRSERPLDPRYQDQIVKQARHIPGAQVVDWDPAWTQKIGAGDIFLHAATNEAFGIVILEAFALGCRMVVPARTFLDDLPDNVAAAGIERVSRPDPEAYAAAMERIASSTLDVSSLWPQRVSVSNLFSVQRASDRLAGIYRSLVTTR